MIKSVEKVKFLVLFKSQFEEKKDEIYFETPFKDLPEWSSMQALIIITTFHEEFNVILHEKELKTAVTVEDLYNLILKKL